MKAIIIIVYFDYYDIIWAYTLVDTYTYAIIFAILSDEMFQTVIILNSAQ